ncbi:MAG: FmdB family zinc ribbon protein [Propionibacteriaceae bacterium]
MPTYQYRCQGCDELIEVVQKFTDSSLTQCPNCNGTLRKVFNAVGIVFKGSGFYATDSRTKGASQADKPAESSSSDKPTTSASSPKSEASTTSAAPAASSTSSSAAGTSPKAK